MVRLGGAIAAITLLSVLGMAVSGAVANSIQGNGEAINLAGSLRMQSWHMASLFLSRSGGDHAANLRRLDDAVATFDATLTAPPILSMLPGTGGINLDADYRRVFDGWHQRIRPRFLAAAASGADALTGASATEALLTDIGGFVDDINLLVKRMAQGTEAKILVMQQVLGAALAVTMLVVMLTIHLIHTRLVKPLRDLLAFTVTVGQGDLSVRTGFTGEDELGRLGRAFDAMSEDLQKLYQDLEERVEQKTAELTRSNRSLELLYHSITRLHGAPPGRDTYLAVLRNIEAVLGLGHGIICLGDPDGDLGQAIATTMQPGDANPCERADCVWCHGTQTPRISIADDGRQLITLPLSDAERQYGVLIVDTRTDDPPEAWQLQLLDALSRHIGVAIGAERRVEQSRRLALLEERAVIARELHDSLAQSLAYMRIQVSRLQGAMTMNQPGRGDEMAGMLMELREGLSGAYRQLRELLSTFRLKMEGEGLGAALARTVEEFAARGAVEIGLDIDLGRCPLTPNEEIHMLHVIREALSNVVNHARARLVGISVSCNGDGPMTVVVEDDGVGIRKPADVHHYGMTIMEERARTLQGDIRYQKREGGGTRVVLTFQPSGRRSIPSSKVAP